MDFCKFFTDIEKDPYAKVDLTVGQYLEASRHAQGCKECYDRIERVVRRADDEGPPPLVIGLN